MKPLILLLTLSLLPGLSLLRAQEVKSTKSSLRLNNIPPPEVVIPPDRDPPSLQWISPRIPVGARHYTREKEMDLVGKVTDSSHILLVSVNGEIVPTTGAGIFTHRLELAPGDNRFRILAMDERENLMEGTFLVEYIPPVVTLADKISSTANYYALIIGIDHYRDREIEDLDNPISDAEKLMNVLSQHYLFEQEHIHFLRDATRADIIQALDELAQKVSPEDNLLIFYAGHGWWDDQAENGYWLPSDAERGVKTNWFRNSTLVDYLTEINTKHTLLIADACFGGSIFKTRTAFGSKERAYEKLYELPSRKAMTSGTLTEVPDRSSFTRYLIRRLEENQETYLSSEELFSSFRLAVMNNSDAVPRFGEIERVGDEGGDFIFLKR